MPQKVFTLFLFVFSQIFKGWKDHKSRILYFSFFLFCFFGRCKVSCICNIIIMHYCFVFSLSIFLLPIIYNQQRKNFQISFQETLFLLSISIPQNRQYTYTERIHAFTICFILSWIFFLFTLSFSFRHSSIFSSLSHSIYLPFIFLFFL